MYAYLSHCIASGLTIPIADSLRDSHSEPLRQNKLLVISKNVGLCLFMYGTTLEFRLEFMKKAGELSIFGKMFVRSYHLN